MNSAATLKRLLSYVVIAGFLMFIPDISFASGFRIEPQGAKAMGMGNAFVAMADDPSAIYYNPAGLAGLNEPALYLGATAVIPSTNFENTSGAGEATESQVFLPPHLYVIYPAHNMAFGLGVYAPFGLGTKWSETGLTRYQATESRIETVNVNPAIAIKVRPWLLFGAGLDYMRSKAVMEKMVDQSLVGGTDAPFSLEGDGYGWGYNAGLIIIPDERLRIGMSYRSAIKIDYRGSASLGNIAPALQPLFGGASYRTNAVTSIRFPEVLSIGVAYLPTEKLTIELDAERVGWSSYDSLKVDLENEVVPAGFTDSTESKGWKDVWAFRAGIDYKASGTISLRAGYAYENNPAPDHTLDPRLPDSDQHDFSVGIGYRSGNLAIDAAYMAALYEDRTVSNGVLSGSYENFAHYLGLSVGYKF